jgi:hypothetical protein
LTVQNVRISLALAIETIGSFAAVAVFVRVFGAGTGPGPSFVAVATVVVMSFGMTRLMQDLDVADSQLRVIAEALSLVALTLILKMEYGPAVPPWQLGWLVELISEPRKLLADQGYLVAGALAIMLLWLRGVVRGRSPLDFTDVLSSATLGVAAVAIAAVAAPPAHGPAAFGPLALLYFVLALCTLALYQTGDPNEPIAAFASRWATAFAVLVGVAIALAVIAAAIDPKSLGFLAFLGRPLLFALEQVAIYVLGPIMAAIAFLFGLIPFHPRGADIRPQPPSAPPENNDGTTPVWFEIMGYLLAGAGLIVLVLAFAAAVWLAMRRFARRMPGVAEQRRSVERHSLLGEDLAALFDNVTRRLRQKASTRSSIEVRRLYHNMLARAEADGVPRPPATTPLQFAPTLDAHYRSDLPSAISQAFVRSRYGLIDFDPPAVRELHRQWAALDDRS